MKIYITHYSKLKDRESHIRELLKKLNMQGQFIYDFDREEINFSEERFIQNKFLWNKQLLKIKKIVIKNILLSKNKSILRTKIYWIFYYIFYIFLTPSSFKFRKLSSSEISLTLKHYHALREIEKSDEPGLIMEDDVILKPETKELIKKSFLLCKSKYDFIDLGGGFDLPLFKEDKFDSDEKRFINLKIPRSRTTAAYMVNPESAAKIADGLFPLVMPIDWQYQFLFLKNDIKVSWTFPSAFIHGSKESKDIFKSSINN